MAAAFANTAAFLFERDLKQFPPERPRHVVPFVVNACFASELFLKSLGHRREQHLEGHELLLLYEALSSEAANNIQAASARVAVRSDPPQFQNTRLVLSELNHAFVEWRYVHEKNHLATVGLGSIVLLLKVLHEACADGDA